MMRMLQESLSIDFVPSRHMIAHKQPYMRGGPLGTARGG
jgi:hypothetical protein